MGGGGGGDDERRRRVIRMGAGDSERERVCGGRVTDSEGWRGGSGCAGDMGGRGRRNQM